MHSINVCTDFSETPGARCKNEGKFSGEEFRESLLIPQYKAAREHGERLTIELDGGYGYTTAFLEEAFGGLAEIFDPKEVAETLIFISQDEPSLIKEIQEYITCAGVKKCAGCELIIEN